MTAADLVLRHPDIFEQLDDRLRRVRVRLADLGLEVGDVAHLDPGDVAIPLEVLERLADLAGAE